MGIVDSLRSMVATLLQVVHTRLELVTTEVQEEMHRIASIALWGIVATFFGGLFVLMVAVTVIIAAGEQHRLTAALVMTGVFLLIVAVAVLMLRARLREKPRLMSHTLDELRRDRERLGGAEPVAPSAGDTGGV